MVLRKRVAFKPNLKQVASGPSAGAVAIQHQPPGEQSANKPDEPITDPPSVISQLSVNGNSSPLEVVSPETNKLIEAPLNEHVKDKPPLIAPSNALVCNRVENQAEQTTSIDRNIELASTQAIQAIGPSEERVREAITQLTSQKFEPIKLLSLKSSANRNVKLKDLLFFNPPMTKDQRRHKRSISLAKKNGEKKRKENQDDSSTNDATTSSIPQQEATLEPEGPSLVPKVKMGPEGKLILDESSTVINRKNTIKEQEAIIEDNEDVISRTNYDSFRRKTINSNQTKWSVEDTKKFYQALTILGTDFSMMESLLFSGMRSRTELHKKFKREERLNKVKVDIALSNRITVTSEELDDLKEIFYTNK